MNGGNFIPCARPTIAKNVEGLEVAVDYWTMEAAGLVVGYGLLEGKMKRLHPSEFNYSEATGEVKSLVSVDESGVAIVSIFQDGRPLCNLCITGNVPIAGAAVA